MKPVWPSEPPRGAGLLKRDGNVVRRAMLIDGELLLAEAAWQGDVVHLRGDERAIERLRFVLALDDDLAPFHRAHRADPLLGRVLKAKPKLRVTRTPDPFEALAWAVMYQLIDTQKAGNIALGLHAPARHAAPERRRGPRPSREAFTNQAALEACGLAPTQARTLARVARVERRSRRSRAARGDCPASASGRSGSSTCSGTDATTCRWPRTSASATATPAWSACAPGSVTEAEFKAVLDRYAPYQGMAALYMTAAGWRGGARYESGHALRRR